MRGRDGDVIYLELVLLMDALTYSRWTGLFLRVAAQFTRTIAFLILTISEEARQARFSDDP